MTIFNRAVSYEPPSTPRNAGWDEALTTCQNLGVDIDPHHAETLTDADLVRLAYREGVRATEHRLMSPDVADAIAVALEDPSRICAEPGYICGTGPLRWQVVAVQQAAVYGVPK